MVFFMLWRFCDFMKWFVYMILASDGTIYTGITTDIKRRWHQHLSGRGGARYFRGRAPTWLLYLEGGHSHGSALRREMAIKKMTRTGKWRQVHSQENQAASQIAVLPVWPPAPEP